MVTRLQQQADRGAAHLRTDLSAQLVRLADDAGVSHRDLARAAGVARSHVDRILAGNAVASHETYARLGAALGADFVARFYPNTGPPIRDPWQARMLEHTLSITHPRWATTLEVLVTRPARGVIDAVRHDARERVLVADEYQSEIRRLEQLIRWQHMKAESLPSWRAFEGLPGGRPEIGHLLIVRRTRATRAVAHEFGRQLRAAYPAHPADALAALVGEAAWPGDAVLWIAIDGRSARCCDDR